MSKTSLFIVLVTALVLLSACITEYEDVEETPSTGIRPTSTPTTRNVLYLSALFKNTPSIIGTITFNNEPPPCVISICEVKYNDEGYRYCVYDPHYTWLRGWRTEADETGGFIIYNVDEGEWALVLDMVTHAIVPNWPDTNEPVVFFVADDKSVYLILIYDDEWPF